ncbi:MAG: DUF2637 domain-containing protein [Acidimicrobiales bacterium]
MGTDELHKIRLRVHLVLGVALLASVAANVLAAEPTAVARCVAAWPPVALLLVVDVLGRVPLASGWGGRLAAGAAGLVALVAAVASFSHVRHVALEVGESQLVAWILPLSVDGLAVVCSVGLVEINQRLRPAGSPDPIAAPVPASLEQIAVEPAPVSLNGSEPVWL